jgi:hypothetical protein
LTIGAGQGLATENLGADLVGVCVTRHWEALGGHVVAKDLPVEGERASPVEGQHGWGHRFNSYRRHQHLADFTIRPANVGQASRPHFGPISYLPGMAPCKPSTADLTAAKQARPPADVGDA